jgi:hypothetical protein
MAVAVPSTVPPNLVRDVAGFARAFVAAHRTRQMYSADHPAAHSATERFWQATSALAAYPDLHVGVSPTALIAGGTLLPADRRVAEAAALLHDHDILSFRVAYPPTPEQMGDFLQLMGFEPDRVRDQGGPARLWGDFGHTSLDLEQIDYDAILAAKSGRGQAAPGPDAADAAGRAATAAQARDGIWTSLVKSMSGKALAYNAGTRDRLRQIAGSADDLVALVTEAVGAVNEPDAAKRRAVQAATILTAFERIVSEVEASRPDLVNESIHNIATAASRLDPALVMDAVEASAESGVAGAAVRGIGDAFDDDMVAGLLAKSMAREGRATGRMAAALNTLTPEPERRQRVLRLAGRLTTAPIATGGASGDVAEAWTTLEHILTGPADTLYTSSDYAFQLQETELRSHRLRMQAPKQLDAWVDSVSVESVRTLSVTLLLDLFAMEESPIGIAETAQDLAGLAEDLLGAADFTEADRVLRALNPAGLAADPRRAAAGRHALDQLAASPAVGEVAAAAGDLDDAQFEWFRASCSLLGPLVIPTLLCGLVAAPAGVPRDRLIAIVIGFGEAAIGPLAGLLTATDWETCRLAIHLVGRIRSSESVSALQPLTIARDPRVAWEAIVTVARIDDPSALRCLATALQHGDRRARHRTVEAVVAAQSVRTAPLLASTLRDLRPFGPDFGIALQILGALRRSSDESVVPAVTAAMHAFTWLHVRQSVAVQRAAAGVLASMPCPGAAAALAEAARTGGFLLKRHARAMSRVGA